MAVDITQFSDDKIYVNNKLVYLDSSGNWITKIELTQVETEALQQYLTS
ncbi:MAG TPA: hypothetical protein VKZ97_10925 [Flavobacteriaceae bacterium]|nr:hypothetical protein [Flavobacteriaceae bacterium]